MKNVMAARLPLTERLSADEMFYILHTDLENIKFHQNALRSEIDEIKTIYRALVQKCILDQRNQTPRNQHQPSPYVTPKTHRTPKTTNYEDLLVQMLLDIPSSCLDDSENSDSLQTPWNDPCTISVSEALRSKLPEPVTPDVIRSTRVGEKSPLQPKCVLENILQDKKTPCHVTNLEDRASKDDSPSSGYPLSSTSSDGHAINFNDREEDLISRVKYYCDFTIDRQRKIRRMKKILSVSDTSESTSNSAEQNGILNLREGDGAEVKNNQPPNNRFISRSCSKQSKICNRYENYRHKVNRLTNSVRQVKTCIHRNRMSDVVRESTTDSSYSTQSSSSRLSTPRCHITRKKHPKCNCTEVHHKCRAASHQDFRIRTCDGSHETYENEQSVTFISELHVARGATSYSDSLYDDGYKSQTLSRKNMPEKSPELFHQCTPANRFSGISTGCCCSLPTPSDAKNLPGNSSPPLLMRLGCEGISSTDTENSAGANITDQLASKFSNISGIDNADSILTESPNSISSGIYAPCNSRNSPRTTESNNSPKDGLESTDIFNTRLKDACAMNYQSPVRTRKNSMLFKVPSSLPPRSSKNRSLESSFYSKTTSVRTSTPMPKIPRVHYLTKTFSEHDAHSSTPLSISSAQTRSTTYVNKRCLIKKFKRFNKSFYKIKHGKVELETLANL